MKSKTLLQAGFGIFAVALGAMAGTVQLSPINYNFPLDGGGGGASATLGGVPVEIYCDDFANDIHVQSTYTAYVTTLGTSADLSHTRFGGIASNGWTPIALNDGNTTLDNQDDAFFNSGVGTGALTRYEMVAYLVSLYNRSLGNNTSNNQIQEAIWTILDPRAEGAAINPSGVNDASYLEQAVTWYTNMNTPANQVALNNFLAGFEVVSSADMSFSNGLGACGFQEQIVMATPEPRGTALVLLVLLCGGWVAMRRNSKGRQKLVDAPV